MKNMRQNSNKNGFTIIEMIIVMVIIGVILAVVLTVGKGATDNSRIASSVGTIRSLQTAAINYYNANGGTYTGGTLGTISVAKLASNGMLPATITGTNAWGGTIAVAPDANASYFDITLVGVPSATFGTALTTAVANIAQTTPTYTAAGVAVNSTTQAAFTRCNTS